MSNKQKLALAIIDFLNQAKTDGSVSEDAAESLDVAGIDSFQVDPSDASQVQKLSVKPATLQSIFNVFLQTKDKVGSGSGEAAAPTSKTPSAADKTQAEKFKQEGNSLMSSKKYDEAIDLYTKAVNLDPTNPVYYSNRAAAHSSKGDHLSAVGDAEKAIEVDPKFTKAYHRLGHAQYSLADYKAAASAFERGLELDPANASFKSGLSNAKARIVPDDDDAPADTAPASGGLGNMSGMADMLRGMGGGAGGGGGGMPDLASLMNNPQMMAMAQQMMANGGLAGLMQNPAVADMV
ncbi:hypothetical protein PC9H_004005 [Pleurotus ostreatus]|uniref:SGTA homodimerisation domain-containing protein n=1 Tax=Pleurotus ostreatus TaxID=5322 RepID=A0A8H7A1W8_PLEOS|nr:uncharacterized protein PC9H_004005 [Pleurotus ostreatus]KAF7437169.1 hypothetical protein PC9H_004005 [Pleurotus ostreatus]